MELLGEFHQAKGLSITLGVRHAEVAAQVLLRVAASLMANDHDRLAVEARPTADDGGIIPVGTIAVQLNEVGECQPDVIERERSLAAAGDLDTLERREIPIDLAPQLGQLAFERGDLVADRAAAGRQPSSSTHRSGARVRRVAVRTQACWPKWP